MAGSYVKAFLFNPWVVCFSLIVGGAILDDGGRMVGSSCIVEFPDRAAVDAWLATDPYVTENVWQKIEVRPFRCAQLD